MSNFENKVKEIIKQTLEKYGIQTIKTDNGIGITDYTDIDYPVDYEIKLERL